MESQRCGRQGSAIRPVDRFAGQRGRHPDRELDRRLLVHGSGGTVRAPKSTLKALRLFVLEDGAPPDELVEVRLLRAFGWTLSELDEQDEARALRILAAENVESALRQIKSSVDQHKPHSVSPEAWKLWKLTQDAEQDEEMIQ